MNLPNKITLSRIFLTVFFIFLLSGRGLVWRSLALAVFLAAAFTDYWDGKLAREMGQITPFGQLMDPIADKLLTLSAYLSFVQMGIIPAWMVVVIITRDVLITGLRLSLPPIQSEKLEARQSGKQKTALQISSIVGILIFLVAKETSLWNAEWTPSALLFIYYGMFLVVVATLWSGLRYLIKNRAFFG